MNYSWGRFYFKSPDIRTDLLLYKDRSYLLLPSEGEENRFLAKASSDSIEFYIGSTSIAGFQAMRGFFSKLYDCRIDEEEPERLDAPESIALLNRHYIRKKSFSYFPGFMSNILYLPSAIDALELQYEVVIRSSVSWRKDKLYNFCTYVTMDFDGRPAKEIKGYINNDVSRLAKERKWRLKLKKGGRVRFRTDLLSDSFDLCNFVRIPSDEGI